MIPVATSLSEHDVDQLDFLAADVGSTRSRVLRALVVHVLEAGDVEWLARAVDERATLAVQLCEAGLHAWQARIVTEGQKFLGWDRTCTRCLTSEPIQR